MAIELAGASAAMAPSSTSTSTSTMVATPVSSASFAGYDRSLAAFKENLTPSSSFEHHLSSGSSSTSSVSSCDHLPTPPDCPAGAGAGGRRTALHAKKPSFSGNTYIFASTSVKSACLSSASASSSSSSSSSSIKRRIRWELAHRPSVASSPKHRHHPYSQHQLLGSRGPCSPLSHFLGTPASSASSSSASHSSSSPSRSHERRKASISRASLAPRSILKRREREHRRSASGRILLPIPQQPTFVAALPANLPHGGTAGAAAAPETLAEITKLNGSGRVHTLAFPDLYARAVSACEPSKSHQAMPVVPTIAAGDSITSAQNKHEEQRSEGGTSVGAQVNGKQGDVEDGNSGKAQAASTDADPRKHIISAMHTLKYSLLHPAWSAPDSSTLSSASIRAAHEQDAFDSSPVDFQPRNLPSSDLTQHEATSQQLPSSLPLLREVEGAYHTVFVYIQAWRAHALSSDSSSSHLREGDRDALDELFATLTGALVACFIRDVHNALHPVPLTPLSEHTAEASSPSAAGPSSSPPSSTPPTSITRAAAKQALLDRPALIGDATPEVQLGAAIAGSSSPMPFAPTPPNVAGEKPKKLGRSSDEMRRRRSEVVLAEAAIQAAGAVLSCSRFWMSIDGARLHEFLELLTQIPQSEHLQGAKYRDLHASTNWLFANQSLIASGSLSPIASPVLLTPSMLTQVCTSVLHSMRSSNKNGEKAKRVVSEAMRALRRLLLASPSVVLDVLLPEVAFVAAYLTIGTAGSASAVASCRPLRDNAAMLLAAIAHGITGGWDDASREGRAKQLVVQEKVSTEVYKHWSMSPQNIELDNLENTLAVSTVSATGEPVLGDCAFVRLMVNTLPVLFGRRFRKMERRGPHTWLRGALALRTAESNGAAATAAAAHHVLAFVHVAYAWALASREAAAKTLAALERQEQVRDQDVSQATEEDLWALGDKALRVIAQNIDSAAAGQSSTTDMYSDSLEVQAATRLATAFIYAFSGLAQTLCWTQSPSGTLYTPSPRVAKDLSKLWTSFVKPTLTRFFAASASKAQHVGWETLLAIVRRAEDGAAHSAASGSLEAWRLDRLVSGHMLAVTKSQAAQTVALDDILADMVTPAEIPAWNAEWIYQERQAIKGVFEDGLKGLRSLEKDGIDQIDWIRSEDGFAILPVAASNAFKALIHTLRNASGQESSQSQPSTRSTELVREVVAFTLHLANSVVQLPEGMLANGFTQYGLQCAILHHLADLVDNCFGSHSLESLAATAGAPRDVLVKAVFSVLPSPISQTSAADSSAYKALLSSTLHLSKKLPAAMCELAIETLTQRARSNQEGDDVFYHFWTALAPHVSSSALADAAVEAYLELLPSLSGTTGEAQQQQFSKVLSSLAAKQDSNAWIVLQRVASKLATSDSRASLFSWALLPLLPQCFELARAEGFQQSVVQTFSSTEQQAQVAEAVFVALRTAVARPNVVLDLQPLLLHLIPCAPAVYTATLEAFTRGFKSAEDLPALADTATLLLAGLATSETHACTENTMQAFAACWNATYGASETPLEYSDEMQEAVKRVQGADLELLLPGWPEPTPEPEPEPEIEQTAEPQTVIEEIIVEVAHQPGVELTAGEVTISQAAVEEEQTQVASQLEESSGDISRLSETQAMPAHVPQANGDEEPQITLQDAAAIEEDVSETLGLRAAGALSPPPPLSQTDNIPIECLDASAIYLPDTPQVAFGGLTSLGREDSDASMSILPETQYPKATDESSGDLDSQISRLEESFVASQYPQAVPDRQTSPDVQAVSPSKKGTGESPGRSLKDLKGEGQAKAVFSPTLPAAQVARTTSEESRLDSPIASSSTTSGTKSASSSTLVRRRSTIIEVVIPYKRAVPRPSFTASHLPQSLPQSSSRKQPSRKAALDSPNLSTTSPYISRSIAETRKAALPSRAASDPLAIHKRAPTTHTSLKRTHSMTIVVDSDDEEDEMLLTASSSPAKLYDVSDSLSLGRKRHAQQSIGPTSSSPISQAEQRKRARSSSNSQGSTISRSSSSSRIGPTPAKRSIQDLVAALETGDKRDLYAVMSDLPEEQVRMLKAAADRSLNVRSSKKQKRH